MSRRLLLIALIVPLLWVAPTGRTETPLDYREMIPSETMEHVWRLARGIGVRVRGTPNERRAALYIARQFEKSGYRVHIQKFEVDGKTSRNVVARWPGVIEHPFVVGGHMDTIAGSPGANDNASGIALMIEMADIISNSYKAKLFKFVAFGSEEYGANGRHHIGSLTYVNRLGRRGRNRSPGMVSVDMIADGRPLLVGSSGIAGDVVANELYRQIKAAGIPVRYRTLCDCSDNGPFEHAGIPASFMWSGDDPDYHAPSDRPRNLNRDHLMRSGRALRAFVLSLTHRDLRRFRRSDQG